MALARMKALAVAGRIAELYLTLAALVAGLFVETWCALRIWGWYAPAGWLTLGLVQAVGMNMAVSLILRGLTYPPKDQTDVERWTKLILHYYLTPLMGLGIAWMVKALWL